MTREEVLLKAATQLRQDAEALKEAHTMPNGNWIVLDAADAQAKASYHETLQLADSLLAMARPVS